MTAVEITMVKPNVPAGSKTLNLKNPTAAAYLNGTLKPEDVILTKNGSVYVKKFKCRVCHYKAAWESEMIRHEVRVHGLDSSAKKKTLPRPIPNLIPIQNNGTSGGNGDSSPNSAAGQSKASTPSKNVAGASPLKNGLLPGRSTYADTEFEKPLTEKDLNDICAKSCANSSLKDFASLIGADESTLKSDKLKDFMSMISDEKDLEKLQKLPDNSAGSATSTASETKSNENDSQTEAKKLPDSFKKKNASFFDRLKEKLMGGGSETHNLVCWCGHKSKCLSESVLHQKTHSEATNEKNEKSVMNGPLISGAELSSTRCQHCRQRCKTSSDLFAHLQSCPEMIKKGNDSSCLNTSQNSNIDAAETNGNEDMPMDEDGEIEDEPEENDEFVENPVTDKEENRVFVWTNFGEEKEDGDEFPDDDLRCKSPTSESSLIGYEIAPGIGSVVRTNDEVPDSYKVPSVDVQVQAGEATTKKVFKCPTCSFWASTASRFHVHIVSHMNVKPFGCSVCPYQSKWKWDVTKHIKLKKERDPLHEQAVMHTIDVETGRRNYTKYNRFLTLMRVHEPQVDYFPAPIKSMAASLTGKSPLTTTPAVPLLPKLTPAPSINSDASSSSAVTATEVAMRPLPQLHPANPTVSMKRPHGGSDDSEVPKKKMPSEKKMWKCKKCKFRNTDRNIVLAHVKEHYTSNSQSANDSRTLASESDLGNSSNLDASRSANDQVPPKGTIKCDICNFETDSSSALEAHSQHHVEDPSAMYMCCFCPFYANDKPFMLDHISTHGVQNPEESLALIMTNDAAKKDEVEDDAADNVEDGNMSDTADSSVNKTDSGAGGDEMEIYKRFKCCSCPYVTNNKSQYLYHKQFHRLRGAPFKCNICSYNVTKRHLLHQHLKIHGVKRAQFKSCVNDAVEKETPENGPSLNTDVYTAHLPDIPLVWVHKSGTLTKMFKCRHCPHVNLRKSNIHEHEKMHFDRIQRSPNGSITTNQTSSHRCTECNYVCNNAGALASHFKVHQGTFGQICALADSRRSDESQIREITQMLKEGRFKKDASKTENASSSDQKKVVALTVEIPAVNSSRVETSDAPAPSEAPAAAPAPTTTSAASRPTPSEQKVLHFCNVCPARFLYQKDLESHSRFHSAHHLFKCNSCTYSAPQQAQLLAHKRVHSNDYQDKTNTLCTIYEVSKEFGRPKTTLILDKPGFAGLGWVVVHISSRKEEPGAPNKPKPMTKQFSCHKCPAQFFKSVALQHHLTLHGGKDQYQCRGCDYRVKTYGNLIKHESVHGLEPRLKMKAAKGKKLGSGAGGGSGTGSGGSGGSAGFPSSGTELFQHRSEQIMKEQSSSTSMATTSATTTPTPPTASNSSLSIDPEFGILMHGSPDFIYPQTVKNGKLKEKRYKCHKCPSAFEKREQYKTHVLLHGAKSRFRCEKCDYSVKYFANYTQHMRKHEMNERCQSERRASSQSCRAAEEAQERAMDVMSSVGLVSKASIAAEGNRTPRQAVSPEKSNNCTPSATPTKSAAKTLHISVADQQAVVLMQEKISDSGVNMVDQIHRCYYCPYSHQRKDAVENHERCHFNPKGSYVCEFCNYTVPQPHFLREHQKLHFGTMKGIKPEAYMKCDRLEIWMETEEGKVLIFKDSGRKENRFEPPIIVNEEESEYQKMYVDVKTGEEFTPTKTESPADEKVEEGEGKSVEPLRKPVFNLASSTLNSESTSSAELFAAPVKEEEPEEVVEAVETEAFNMKEEPLEDEVEEENLHLEEDEEEDVKDEDFAEEDDVDDDEEEAEDVEAEDDGDEQEMTEEFEDEDSTVNEVIEETVEMDVDAELEPDVEAEAEADVHAELGSNHSDSEAELSDEAEVETVAETIDRCDSASLAEEMMETLEKSNDGDIDLPDMNEIDTEMEACEKTTDVDENTAFTDVTKTLTDDSDSEDSDSDSSSSSSCSDSSCSSSDSSNGATDEEDKVRRSTKQEESKPDPPVIPDAEPPPLEESQQD